MAQIMFANTNLVEGFKDYICEYLHNTHNRTDLHFDSSKSFEEKGKLLNANILKEVERIAGVPLKMENVSDEMMANHPNVRFAAFAVVGTLIDYIVPVVIEKKMGLYTNFQYGGYGDSMRIDVKPNDLFVVSKAGRNQRTVDFQRQYSGTQYIVPENRAITVFVNLYRVLCGLDSLAEFAMKAVLSLEAQMSKEVYGALVTALGSLPTSPADGALKITASGGVVNKTATIRLAEAVSAYNGGAPVVMVGTKAALSHVMPDATAGFRYLDASIAYFQNVWGIDTIALDQVADWQNKYKLALDDSKIFVISPSSQKLVQVFYEGSTTTNIVDAKDSADFTTTTTMHKSYGIGIATNAIAGLISIEA